MNDTASFPPEVMEKLQYYVYRLIDPRYGETFYVGKGKGNRVFSHAKGDIGADDDFRDGKLKRINDIKLAGLSVGHVIHRHGMDAATAFAVESALIDAYPGLENDVDGVGGSEFGTMHATEILTRYCAPEATFEHRALLISVNRSAENKSLYEATRYAWKISKSNAEQAQLVLSVRQGLIVGAFVADRWLEATADNFPGREGVPGRFGFVGKDASEELKKLYVGKRLPEEFRKPGASNPVKYSWN
jgi:hypothetical protein